MRLELISKSKRVWQRYSEVDTSMLYGFKTLTCYSIALLNTGAWKI
nr:MAG TPA: hypothetical protein [Caudoviricetes sp.]